MNNSTLSPCEEEILIQQLNDEKADLMIPATVYIVVLMVSGLIGNSMVVYYYTFKTKVTTNSVFIISLALYDLIVCSICMPTEIADIVLFYTFESAAACKILRFLNYLAAMSSILTLIAIGVDRYKKIYKWTGRQMTMLDVKKISVAVFVTALILSWPSILIYGSIKVPIPNDLGLTLYGYDCTSTKDRAYRGYVWAFNIVHFVMFIICSGVLIVLYSIIGHTIYKHRKQFARYGNKLKPFSKKSTDQETTLDTTSSAAASESRVSCASKTHSQSRNSNCSSVQSSTKEDATKDVCAASAQVNQNKTCANNDEFVQSTPSPQNERHYRGTVEHLERKLKNRLDNESVRITMVMIAVTVLFIASFLPYLSLTVWRLVEGKHEAQFLSGAGLVAFKIVSRSFLLNSSLNPWIYGVFNSSFRKFYFDKLRCRKV